MYHLLVIQNKTTPSLISYNTYNDVYAAFHTELAYRHESRTSTICYILNSEGDIIDRGTYTADVNNN